MMIKDFKQCQQVIEYPISNPLSKTYFRDLAHPQHDEMEIKYSFAHFVLERGSRSVKFRFHKASDLIFILEGSGKLLLEDQEIELKESQVVFIPPGKARIIMNSGQIPLKFVSIAEPAFSPEDTEILEEAKFEVIGKKQ